VALSQGDSARSITLAEDGVDRFRKLGYSFGGAQALHVLQLAVLSQGDYMRARDLLKEGLALGRGLGNMLCISWSLNDLARVAGAQRRPQCAARLFGAAETLREQIGAPLLPVERPDYKRDVSAIHTQLDEVAFATAWAEGRTMTLEQAIAYALEQIYVDDQSTVPPQDDVSPT
jgi:hypothetical protein